MKLRGIAIRNIKRNNKRSLLSITATAIATYAIVFMFYPCQNINSTSMLIGIANLFARTRL